MFDLQQVHRRFGRTTGLAGVDLHVAPGRTTALIGPNGAGKSTVLRMLLGLEWPDSGEVRFDGAPLQRAQLPALRRRIGYVIQEGGLFPHLDATGTSRCSRAPWAGRGHASKRASRNSPRSAGCRTMRCAGTRRNSPAASASASA